MKVGLYLESNVRAVITTLTNYLTVDNTTWTYIQNNFRPALDKNTGEYQIKCNRMRQLRFNFNVQSSGTNTQIMIPGTELIQQTKSGYCILKIQPSTNDIWTLGGPFLRHHCVHFDLANQQLTFVNNTIFSPWKKHIY